MDKAKADFIREIAPKIALTLTIISPTVKNGGIVDFSSAIQLAASWYDEIEEYIVKK